MDKETVTLIGTIFRWLVGAIGLLIVVLFLVKGISKKEKSHVRKAGVVFASVWILLGLLALVEFLLLLSLFP
ncbi:MAG TPA: hypothetical protein DGG95_11445 [Cytophagales bacterium]|jgi:hypothetical protein|nr:hypothetical protein [Cytophagales bacterium]